MTDIYTARTVRFNFSTIQIQSKVTSHQHHQNSHQNFLSTRPSVPPESTSCIYESRYDSLKTLNSFSFFI